VALLVLNLFKDSAEYNLATLLPQIKAKPVTGAAFLPLLVSSLYNYNTVIISVCRRCVFFTNGRSALNEVVVNPLAQERGVGFVC